MREYERVEKVRMLTANKVEKNKDETLIVNWEEESVMMTENKAECFVTVVVVIVREEDWSGRDCLKLKDNKGLLCNYLFTLITCGVWS